MRVSLESVLKGGVLILRVSLKRDSVPLYFHQPHSHPLHKGNFGGIYSALYSDVSIFRGRTKCPLSFYPDAADYDKSRVDVTFRPCVSRQCVAVPIIDDCSLERDENFTISLEPEVGLTNRIITNDSLTVTIEDDDSKKLSYSRKT